MIRTIRVQLGRSPKNIFEKNFDTEDNSSVVSLSKEYEEFFIHYRDTHSISSRRWNFPVVYFKDNDGDFYPKYKVSPNGSWVEIKDNE